ncbi:unnamed protein product [Phytomonas sp. EM1]|nr:unnamed protein product [Phytomonas sp. EM1]|eukprot:CCW62501.1 unnamed protein product [Phytomonas sp. isolate EM1]
MVFSCCSGRDDVIIQKRTAQLQYLAELGLHRNNPPQLLREETAVPVTLNIYSLTEKNAHFEPLGLGIFHCGVVIYGIEWSYGEVPDNPNASGLFCIRPGKAIGMLFKTLTLGYTTKSPMQVDTILHRLENEWRSSDYHILHHNCNHFAQRLCDLLSTSEKLKIPTWCNRVASISDKVVPKILATKIQRMFHEEPLRVPKSLKKGCISGIPTSVIPQGWYLHPSIKQLPRYTCQSSLKTPMGPIEAVETRTSSVSGSLNSRKMERQLSTNAEAFNNHLPRMSISTITEVMVRMDSSPLESRLVSQEDNSRKDTSCPTVPVSASPVPAIPPPELHGNRFSQGEEANEREVMELPKVLRLSALEESSSCASSSNVSFMDEPNGLHLFVSRCMSSTLDAPVISEEASAGLWGSASNKKKSGDARQAESRTFSAFSSEINREEVERSPIMRKGSRNEARSSTASFAAFQLPMRFEQPRPASAPVSFGSHRLTLRRLSDSSAMHLRRPLINFLKRGNTVKAQDMDKLVNVPPQSSLQGENTQPPWGARIIISPAMDSPDASPEARQSSRKPPSFREIFLSKHGFTGDAAVFDMPLDLETGEICFDAYSEPSASIRMGFFSGGSERSVSRGIVRAGSI